MVLIFCSFSSLFCSKVLEAVGTVSWSHACFCNSPSKMDSQESEDVCSCVCVCVYRLRKARVKMVKTPRSLSPPPPSRSQSVLPVRRWWWRPGSLMTSGVSQAAWWGVLGWRESWMAVRYYWCQCGRGSALDSAVYCFPLCWMCWMQGFHASCTGDNIKCLVSKYTMT